MKIFEDVTPNILSYNFHREPQPAAAEPGRARPGPAGPEVSDTGADAAGGGDGPTPVKARAPSSRGAVSAAPEVLSEFASLPAWGRSAVAEVATGAG